MRRRTRLRAVAFPTRPLTVIPSRACGRSFGAAYSTRSGVCQPRGARSRTAWKSALVRRRSSRFTARAHEQVAAGVRLNDREALAGAQAPTLEDGASGGGEHALQKAVLPLTRDAFRLVRTLGHERSVLQEAGRRTW